MSKLARFSLILALTFPAGAVLSQETEQATILGPSGDPTYPLRVRGANDVVYHCRDYTEERNGRTVRPCRRSDAAGAFVAGGAGTAATPSLLGGGAAGAAGGGVGFGTAAALAGGLIGTIAIIAASDTNN